MTTKGAALPNERLTHAEELELIKNKEDKRTLDRLVVSNLGLVHKIVHKFPLKNANCSYDDLFQEGVAGLLHGISKFDPKRGYRLSTYVYRWIQSYVTRYYQNHGRSVRVPVHMATKQMQVKKVTEELTRDLGRTPTSEEILDMCPVSREVAVALQPISSLNQMVNESDELECLQGEDKTQDTDTKLECELILDRVEREVSPRDFNILLLRYGLRGKPAHTLSEVAEIHGITRARVNQIEKQCVRACQQLV